MILPFFYATTQLRECTRSQLNGGLVNAAFSYLCTGPLLFTIRTENLLILDCGDRDEYMIP